MILKGRKALFNLICFICLVQPLEAQLNMEEKIIIAHRGASGYLPEHTLESKALAYGLGADYLEQDLVLSRDDVVIVMHDIFLDEVTNVATIFPDRVRNDGRYYVIDFNYEELLELKVHERVDRSTGEQVFPERFPKDKSSFSVPSLNEEIEMIQGINLNSG
ncbi:MAG: glycerophosphodiester phosphodiesterase family protein, partial [Desulfobulbia bacterium]